MKNQDNAIAVNLRQTFKYGMTPEELYEKSRGEWKINRKHLHKIKYVLATFSGIVQEVYEVEGWYENGDRKLFHGRIAPETIREKYLNKQTTLTGSFAFNYCQI